MAQEDIFEGMAVFVKVVEAGSFSAAAETLGVSPSFVSKQINRLENRLQARLLQRSTRSLSLTEVGQMYFVKARDMVLAAREMENSIHSMQENPVGLLKVSVPLSFGHLYLKPMICDFMKLYHQVELQVDFSSRLVDLAGEGVDVAIRLGESKDSSLISRKLASFDIVTCATPQFWSQFPRVDHPNKLRNLPSVKYHYQQAPLKKEYFVNGESLYIDVLAVAQTNHLPMQLDLILNSIGFGRLPTFIAQPYLDSGELVQVLDDFEMPTQGIYAVYPHRHHLSAKVRAFVDLLINNFK